MTRITLAAALVFSLSACAGQDEAESSERAFMPDHVSADFDAYAQGEKPFTADEMSEAHEAAGRERGLDSDRPARADAMDIDEAFEGSWSGYVDCDDRGREIELELHQRRGSVRAQVYVDDQPGQVDDEAAIEVDRVLRIDTEDFVEVDFELLSTPSAPGDRARVTLFSDAYECEGVVLRD